MKAIEVVRAVLRHQRAVVIYGFGTEGQRFLNICEALAIPIVEIVDDQVAAQGGRAVSFDTFAAKNEVDKSVVVLCTHSPERMRKKLTERFPAATWLPLSAFQAYEPTIFTPFMFYEGLIADKSTAHI